MYFKSYFISGLGSVSLDVYVLELIDRLNKEDEAAINFQAMLFPGAAYGATGYYYKNTKYGAIQIIEYGEGHFNIWYVSIHKGNVYMSNTQTVQTPKQL